MQATRRGWSPAPKELSLGHSLPAKAGTDGSLPPTFRTGAHGALLEAHPCAPHHRGAADPAGCYDVSHLQPEAECWPFCAVQCSHMASCRRVGDDAMPMRSARPHEPGPHLLHFRAGDAALRMIIDETHSLHEGMDRGRADKGPSTLLQIL